MICEVCNNKMTLMLHSYVCDWCDGIVEKEWKDEEITDPCPFSGITFDIDTSTAKSIKNSSWSYKQNTSGSISLQAKDHYDYDYFNPYYDYSSWNDDDDELPESD